MNSTAQACGAMAVRQAEIEKSSEFLNSLDICTVLVLVTGGTLTMVQSENGYVASKGLADRLKIYKQFYDEEKAKELELGPDTLITPVTPYGKRIKFMILEWDDLIDSSNIKVEQQLEIARVIYRHYKSFDGFVVLHGTDTMAYTSSLLSFCLENLNKTVCVTGS